MRKTLFISSVVVSLAGCSQNSSDLMDTLGVAFGGPKENLISQEEVDAIPYASQYVQMDGNGQALLVLGWVERSRANQPRLKWVSADHEMVVTQAGRVVKTTNLKQGNLLSDSSETIDPLALGILNQDTPQEWHHTISWMPHYHIDYQAVSHFSKLGNEQVTLPSGEVSLTHVIERVSIPTLNVEYSNHYWVRPDTSKVIYSQQYFYPNSPQMILFTGKPFMGVTQ